MNILSPSIEWIENSQNVSEKIWKIINDSLLKVFNLLSISDLQLSWLENIDINKSYLIIANHPSFLDGFLIRDLLQKNWILINWIMHNKLLELKFLWDFFKKQWHIWVLSKRDIEYYLDKWCSFQDAESMSTTRTEEAKVINSKTFKKCKTILEAGWKVFIFISWAWYMDRCDNPAIYNWYKKIIRDFLEDNESLNVLPITIDFNWWFKSNCFPLRNVVKVNILPNFLVNSWNSEEVHEQIKLIYNPRLTDV